MSDYYKGPHFVGVLEYVHGGPLISDATFSHRAYGMIYTNKDGNENVVDSQDIGTLAEIAAALFGWGFREVLNFEPPGTIDRRDQGLPQVVPHAMDEMCQQRFSDAAVYHLNRKR
ncbi:TPA: hypothetical protein HA241_05940 [Candidatus Woesearchaeota archaeon]|nr:hypothetical protein [Candidatus Woesearchaeota archaeon]